MIMTIRLALVHSDREGAAHLGSFAQLEGQRVWGYADLLELAAPVARPQPRLWIGAGHLLAPSQEHGRCQACSAHHGFIFILSDLGFVGV